MEGKVVIEVKNAKKVYKMGQERIKAVDGVSFTVNEGEFCCLLGTSGSGKSTLLNLMAGIEKLSSGDVIIKGQSIAKMSENKLAKFRQEHLGFVFQSYNLIGSMTALENVEFPLVFKKVPSKKRRAMAKKMLIAVGLKGRLKHKPKEMSGGQQQRVGIARAFVAKPAIVFADEPTGNLDSRTTLEVMDLIKAMARENKQTVVMVTHDRRLTEYADKVINILDGHIQSIEVKDTSADCIPDVVTLTEEDLSPPVLNTEATGEAKTVEAAEVDAEEVAEATTVEAAEVDAEEVAEAKTVEAAEVDAEEAAEATTVEAAEVDAEEVAEATTVENVEMKIEKAAEVKTEEVVEMKADEIINEYTMPVAFVDIPQPQESAWQMTQSEGDIVERSFDNNEE